MIAWLASYEYMRSNAPYVDAVWNYKSKSKGNDSHSNEAGLQQEHKGSTCQ